LKPIEPAGAEHDVSAVSGQAACGGCAQAAARAGDDDDLACDVLVMIFNVLAV
jgi:hypothetical protein